MKTYPPVQLTPREFEERAKAFVEATGNQLQSYRAEHREKLGGADGEYEIDVAARFSAIGLDFLVLIECKHYRRQVEW
jgi:restriction system protein